jgi:hypothetical protein
LIEANVSGTNIVLADGEYFAIPSDGPPFTIERVRRGEFRRLYRAPDLECLKLALRVNLPVETTPSSRPLPARRLKKPPRDDGVFVWSLRHPRKALRHALSWAGALKNLL